MRSPQPAQTADMVTTARLQSDNGGAYGRKKFRRALACSLLFYLFSFLGWVFEKILFFFAYGVNADRGFLTLPFCTVYGAALILIRVCLGLPKLDAPYPLNLLRFLGYALAAGLIATVVELGTGLFFEEVFDARLWTYADFPHSYRNYIALPVSIGWGAAIGAGMAGVWAPLENRLTNAPVPVLAWSSSLFTLAIALDFFLTAFL